MMFRKNIITIIVLFSSIGAFSQNNTFELSSKIENLEGKAVHLTIWDGTSTSRNKTVPVLDGQFNYSEMITSPLVIRISPTNQSLTKRPDPGKSGAYPTKAASIWCVVQPGEKVKLLGKLTDYAEVIAEGGKENEICNKFTQSYFPLLNKQMDLQVRLARDTSSATIKAALKTELAAANQVSFDVLKKFVAMNSSSIIGLYLMNDLMLRKQLHTSEASNLLKVVDNKYGKTGFYKLVESRINSEKYAVGTKMMPISGALPNGNKFSSTDLTGKYYLIDFWGTWCVPCMAAMPHLKALKNKYVGKLEILGIDNGDTAEKWKKAITEKGLDWHHIMNGKGESDYVSKLNVVGFPTTILVGPDGTILYRSTGTSEDLDVILDKYLSADK